MTEPRLAAKTIGNPNGGFFDNPWPPDFPAVGQRVAVFCYEVTKVDDTAQSLRTYHVAPAETAETGPVGPAREEDQGIAVAWRGCGTGVVVYVDGAAGHDRTCAVTLDDEALR